MKDEMLCCVSNLFSCLKRNRISFPHFLYLVSPSDFFTKIIKTHLKYVTYVMLNAEYKERKKKLKVYYMCSNWDLPWWRRWRCGVDVDSDADGDDLDETKINAWIKRVNPLYQNILRRSVLIVTSILTWLSEILSNFLESLCCVWVKMLMMLAVGFVTFFW